jgi:hypothetical protein
VSVALEEVEDALVERGDLGVRLPALVRGRLVLADSGSEGSYTIRRPLLDARRRPTGGVRTLVVPAVDPEALVEPHVPRELLTLPSADVLDYVRALRTAVGDHGDGVRAATELIASASGTTPGLASAHAELLRGLLDADGLGDAIDRDLGSLEVPGRRYLDGWVPGGQARSGMAAELRNRIFSTGPEPQAPWVRALPTRQLHISAGNSPVIALVSALRAFAIKSPAVIKSSSDSLLGATLLAMAMHAVDPGHPLTRHTSLVCWPGGDRRVEDRLLAPGAFDRLVAWGSADTLASLRARAPHTRAIFLEPRTGASLIGRDALAEDLAGVAALAASDSLAEDQQSCHASLVHYVEGTPDEAIAYCEALRSALGRWDVALPQAPASQSVGQFRRLRRGQLARARWFTNARDGVVTSSVVCASGPFDVAMHPAGRCVVVQPVRELADAVEQLDSGISVLGVAPETRRTEFRDAAALRGISNVVPLGDAERAFAGMPHDGRRILSELVSWATA